MEQKQVTPAKDTHMHPRPRSAQLNPAQTTTYQKQELNKGFCFKPINSGGDCVKYN